MPDIKLHESWKWALKEEFEKPYFQKLSQFVKDEILAGKTLYPHPKNIFAALDQTPFDAVKVIILGQDPYHGPGQAHGLSFSVQEWVRNPPSLANIFKEIEDERKNWSLPPCQVGIKGGSVSNGDLTRWAHQGVLLLNTTLTVRAGQPMSHAGKWWENFTDAIIQTLSKEREFLVFLLWGSHAQKKRSLIDTKKHIILEAPHPSPLSSYRGFFGCKHFSQTNALLREHGMKEIEW
jgi:uracil-DNA glycosylase